MNNPQIPVYLSTGGYDIPGNIVPSSITGFGNYLFVGATNSTIYVFDVSNPASISLVGSYITDSPVNGLALSSDDSTLFTVHADNLNNEFSAFDVSAPAVPQFINGISTNSSLRSASFDYTQCAVYAAGEMDAIDPEFVSILSDIITPTPTPEQATPTPTPTPLPPTPTPTSTPTLTPTPYPCPTEASCLEVIVSGAYVGGGGDKELRGLTIRRTAAPVITVTGMTVSWSITGRSIDQIRMDGSNLWSGTANSGSLLDIIDYQPGQTGASIDKLKFNSDMSGSSFVIIFHMADGSSKTINVNNPPDG